MSSHSTTTQFVQTIVDRLHAGDESAKNDLIQAASERLFHLTQRKRRRYQRKVGRWEQTEDIFQRAIMRLCQALEKTEINDAKHFFSLAAKKIREQLLDLERYYHGPVKGIGANHQTQVRSSSSENEYHNLIDVAKDEAEDSNWLESEVLYSAIEKLHPDLQDVINMVWINELTQEETAKLLGISVRTVYRRWQKARIELHDLLSPEQ